MSKAKQVVYFLPIFLSYGRNQMGHCFVASTWLAEKIYPVPTCKILLLSAKPFTASNEKYLRNIHALCALNEKKVVFLRCRGSKRFGTSKRL